MKGFIRHRRLAAEWWLIALAASALALFLVQDRTTQRLDALFYDLLLHFDRQAPDPRILIVAIDDHSTQEMGAWPWPRDLQAQLIARLAEAGPAAVAYDVLLVEPRPGDAQLTNAISGTVPVFLPLLMRAPGSNGAPFDIIPPVPELAEAASALGHVNLDLDADGKVRRALLSAGDERRRYPHLMMLMHEAAEPGELHVPAGADPLLIPFSGQAGHFPAVGASSVLRGEVPPELLQGRLVLVGATAGGLGDRYATAGGNSEGVLPGVEVQAHLLDGLLSDRMIAEAPAPGRALFALVPVWILLIALRMLRPGPILVLLAGLAALVIAVAAGALLEFRMWFAPVPALVTLALVYPLWGWRRLAAASSYMSAELERFHAEGEEPPRSYCPAAAIDPVSRQIALLHDTIEQTRDLQREREETLQFLSHDMRSPQASILALLSDAKGREIDLVIGERIESYAQRTIDLADGFVQLARAGMLRFEPEPVNLTDVVLDALDQLWPGIAAKQLKIELSGEDSHLLVAGERSLLTRAVINLLDNAVRHSPACGRLACALNQASEGGVQYATCRIVDEGPGIARDHLSVLFERFRQAPGMKRANGVGLGLAQVHTVAVRHGGWVRCDNAPGAGAAFTLGIPVLIEAQPALAEEEAEELLQ